MDNIFIMAVIVIVIICCISRVPSDAEVAKEHILSRALKSLVHAFVSPGNPAGRDKKTQEQKSPLTTGDLADSMIMKVSLNDPFFLKCRNASDTRFNPQYETMVNHDREREAHSTFKKWLENHPEWIFNLSCLAIILPESFSMKLDFSDFVKRHNECADLERLLVSIDQQGQPNCKEALTSYLSELSVWNRTLNEDICRVLIQDPRFDEVKTIVNEFLEKMLLSAPLEDWRRQMKKCAAVQEN